MRKSPENHPRHCALPIFVSFAAGPPAQASPLRSEASRALRYGDKNRRPVPKGD